MATKTREIKIGRWTYPLEVRGGKVMRNEKRDGSGSWLAVTDKQMPKAEQAALIASAGPGAETSADYDTLREIYTFVFNSFAVDYDEVSVKFNLRPGRAKAAISKLVRSGLVNVDHVERSDGKPGKQYVIQSAQTYDNWSLDEAIADFVAKVPASVKIPNPSTHGGVKGAQTRKPGKSTWKVGSPCPQGHTIRKGRVYVMPNGRHICLECRDNYASVKARKAGSK